MKVVSERGAEKMEKVGNGWGNGFISVLSPDGIVRIFKICFLLVHRLRYMQIWFPLNLNK